MRILFGLLITVSIYGVIHYWNTDKMKRNIAALISIGLVVTFNLFIREEEPKIDSDSEVYEKVIENPTFDYKIVNRKVEDLKDSPVGDFSGYFIYAVTEEQLNKNQIKDLLYKIKEENDEEKTKDDLYILLYENEIIADRAYSLGRLADLEEGIEVNARQKDWDKQPSEEQYKVYTKFIHFAEEKEEASTDEKIAEELGERENLDKDFILESVRVTETFIKSDES